MYWIAVIYIGFIQNDDIEENICTLWKCIPETKSGLHLSHHSVELFIYRASVYDYFDI